VCVVIDTGGVHALGTTELGGNTNGSGGGTVFEVIKGAGSYASAPTTLYVFCAQTNCADGAFPYAGLIADANGNLFGTTYLGGPNAFGTVFEIIKTASGYTNIPIILASFSGNGTDGEGPIGNLTIDANGNLFGVTGVGSGMVFEVAKTANGYAPTPIILYTFCPLANCADGAVPSGSLIIDAIGNLFGTTEFGRNSTNCFTPSGCGTVFEIAKTVTGYASSPTILYSFCSSANCVDGAFPETSLIAAANGNLFGTTEEGGANGGYGTVFELTGSGFIPPGVLAGTPGNANCIGKSVSGLTGKYGTFLNAAAALGYSVKDLQNEVVIYCGG
jgi:hypothetical protein